MRPISLKITLRKIKEIKIESEDIERRESGTAEPGSWGGFSSPPRKFFFGNFQWIALLLLTLIRLILTSYSRTQVKYIKVFTRWNEAVEVPVILQVIQIEFFWMKYLMENVKNSISEPLNSKSFGGMICHRFQATPPPRPTSSGKNTLRRPWGEEKTSHWCTDKLWRTFELYFSAFIFS